jgi:amiloride-sensitive sodium channel
MTACRQEHLMKYCNCTVGFLFPTEGNPECNVTGLICLIKYNEIFNAEKVDDSPFFDKNEEGIECACLPECSRIEYSITMTPIYDEKEIDEEFVKVDVHYASASMMKYRTDVTFGFLDLVVGFGGIMGLFFGCSLLSGAEIFYFSTIGLFYQYRRNRGKIVKKVQAKFPFLN